MREPAARREWRGGIVPTPRVWLYSSILALLRALLWRNFLVRLRQRIAKIVGSEERTIADAGQQIGLRRLKFDQASEHVQEVEKIGGVFSRPAFGLNLFERRWRTPVADDGPSAVALAIAEPVPHDLLARDLIGPHLRRDVIDITVADLEPAFFRVVIHAVRERFGRGGDRAFSRNERSLVLQTWCVPLAVRGGIGEALP